MKHVGGKAKPRFLRAWAIITGALVVVLLAAAAMLGPMGIALLKTEQVEGTVEIGGGVTADPGAGWTVEPLVADFPASPIDSWTGLLADEGSTLRSPDRVLEVDLETAGADPAALLPQLGGAGVLTETLASGATVQHTGDEDEIVAVLEGVGDETVRMHARVSSGEGVEVYRPAISELLESLSSATSN